MWPAAAGAGPCRRCGGWTAFIWKAGGDLPPHRLATDAPQRFAGGVRARGPVRQGRSLLAQALQCGQGPCRLHLLEENLNCGRPSHPGGLDGTINHAMPMLGREAGDVYAGGLIACVRAALRPRCRRRPTARRGRHERGFNPTSLSPGAIRDHGARTPEG